MVERRENQFSHAVEQFECALAVLRPLESADKLHVESKHRFSHLVRDAAKGRAEQPIGKP
jgi:hypothetical protein